jgi:nucleoid DNA-binding protein
LTFILGSEGGIMNKSQLVEKLAKTENLTIKTAEDIVNTIFKEM